MLRVVPTVVLALLVTACAGQSRMVDRPIGISSGINGLQQSVCNCGGLQPKAEVEARLKADEKAQRLKHKQHAGAR